MLLFISFAMLLLTFSTIYLDIDDDIRSVHSKSYIKKQYKRNTEKMFFVPFIKEINKLKYFMLIFCYIISAGGIILSVLNFMGIINDSNLLYNLYGSLMIILTLILFLVKIIVIPLTDYIREKKEFRLKELITSIIFLAGLIACIILLVKTVK